MDGVDGRASERDTDRQAKYLVRGVQVLRVLLGVERPGPVDEGRVEGRLELGELLVAHRQLERAVRQLGCCGRVGCGRGEE